MKVRELLAFAGPDAEIFVRFDETEDEVGIEPLVSNAVQVEMYKGKRRIVIDANEYFCDVFGADSDQ